MSGKPPFDEVWKRISVRAGDVFFTKTGLRFTYKVEDDKVIISRARYKVSKNDLRRAYEMSPLGGPSQLSSAVRGPTYVWAILHDARVTLRQW
ncbi:MAG: hypothetical protein V1924_08365 [Candidatus Bathyarchaeota archaeon]